MTGPQIAICLIVLSVSVLFIWGRWRYDVVAFAGLMAAVLAGLVPAIDAFDGFGHPAVVTVLAVLVISRALANSALVVRASASPALHVAVLAGVAAFLSAFMNNVAALALLLPVALQSCVKVKRSPGLILMPLAFGSILGGLATMIGTPPNVIIASYRSTTGEPAFGMFDFTPVGLPIAIVGVAFVALIGWHLLPAAVRKRNIPADLGAIEDYITEAKVTEDSSAVDVALHELDEKVADSDVQIIALIRDGHRMLSAARYVHIRVGDVLMLSASPEGMAKAVSSLGLELVGEKSQAVEALKSEDVTMLEAIVPTGSRIEGHTPSSLRLGSRYDLNLLAVSRQGQPTRGRLRSFRFQAGDILLLQGEREHANSALGRLGLLPLAERKLAVGAQRRAIPAVAIFATAVITAALGLAPITITFSVAMLAMVLLGMVSLRDLYDAIDWPVLVLLGAMIPVGGALETTGTTELLASGLLSVMAGAPPLALLAVILVVTMTLSDIMNNAATAIVMAPIAVGVASALGVATDPFLMAVAIGASCAFLTPIGHQNNTLIMGPGGYRFGDYWRMGLPLEIIIVALTLVLLPMVWPLQPV